MKLSAVLVGLFFSGKENYKIAAAFDFAAGRESPFFAVGRIVGKEQTGKVCVLFCAVVKLDPAYKITVRIKERLGIRC